MYKKYKSRGRRPYRRPEPRDEREALTNTALFAAKRILDTIPNTKISVLQSETVQRPIGRRLKKRQKARFKDKQTTTNFYLITILVRVGVEPPPDVRSKFTRAYYELKQKFNRKDLDLNLSLTW